ncbi:sodium:proton antiporter [Finegoldia sp. BIOML-A3]|uniref:cation:proton antiporter n=1 Tax=unclassified Finegoldia TaxID=2619637 RepID=UPI0012B0CAFC|nr:MULTISPECIES: cation:proton antiporter [unclassified Finegoldia]MDU4208356.1 cation:proton antiporter [Finegoldia magna]MSA98696.1 sodium:proton antiporter [Finegoldia sp. BIOML-A3]MSB92698.1 sodium:proton antiporter [Finegoldia sp. BIOML-A4]
MLRSIAIIIILSLLLGKFFKKIKLPPILAFLIVGITLGPFAMNLIDKKILDISSEVRTIALVIILTRAGLSLDIDDLKKIGRPAVLMCFVPAVFEMCAVGILAPIFLKVDVLDAFIIGSIIAAVSPAVVVPRMIRLIEEGYGDEHKIPQLILAGSSCDDVFCIVVFTSLTSLAQTGDINVFKFIAIPFSILIGSVVGAGIGFLLVRFFKRFHMRDTVKVLIVLSISFLILELEKITPIPFSGLIAIMAMSMVVKKIYEDLAERLSEKYNKLWVGAEIFLFVLVGATVNVKYAINSGIMVVVLVICALIFRMIGVYASVLKTKLTPKERLFCMIAYTPKATVQAAIGAIPLSMGLQVGDMALTVAVISILITAPFGAIMVDNLYKKLLTT